MLWSNATFQFMGGAIAPRKRTSDIKASEVERVYLRRLSKIQEVMISTINRGDDDLKA